LEKKLKGHSHLIRSSSFWNPKPLSECIKEEDGTKKVVYIPLGLLFISIRVVERLRTFRRPPDHAISALLFWICTYLLQEGLLEKDEKRIRRFISSSALISRQRMQFPSSSNTVTPHLSRSG
jgi:hypothetical protein